MAEIIEQFGGTPRAYVANRVRGLKSEQAHIKALERRDLPLVCIPDYEELHTEPAHRQVTLLGIGKTLARVIK